MIELNQQQIAGQLRLVLGVGGPVGALILSKTGISHADYALYLEAAVAILPWLIASVWSWARNRKATQVKITEALPEVATIVVKNNANGNIGALAASDEHPNIVTESQNEADAKLGAKT